MASYYLKLQNEAAEKVRNLLALPIPDDMETSGPGEDEFDPWRLFPGVMGCYDEAFDLCALDVLQEVANQNRVREDLAADMFREMLCQANLCDYGTSPRFCWATLEFKPLLPSLIQKWDDYAKIAWA